MNALTAAIETVKAIAMDNHKAEQVKGWEVKHGGLAAGWKAHADAQRVELVSVEGVKVTVIASFTTAAGTTQGFGAIRVTYKINGKRAKGSDVAELTFADAVPATEQCPHLNAKHEVVKTVEGEGCKSVICKVLGAALGEGQADFFATVSYSGHTCLGARTWHTIEQAESDAAKWTGAPAALVPVTRITFMDKGQDFLEWYVRNGIVIDCQPHQGQVWVGTIVQNMSTIQRGLYAVVVSKITGMAVPVVTAPVERLEVLPEDEARKVEGYGAGWASMKGISVESLGL